MGDKQTLFGRRVQGEGHPEETLSEEWGQGEGSQLYDCGISSIKNTKHEKGKVRKWDDRGRRSKRQHNQKQQEQRDDNVD